MIVGVFHAATFGYYMFVLWYWLLLKVPLNMNVNMPHVKQYWWQYLTIWNMWFQGINFVVCVVDDAMQSSTPRKELVKVKKKLEWARDTLFLSLTLPLGTIIPLLFWVTYAYDRELVYPAGMDAIVPSWFNHVIHTAILFFPWAEVLICQRPFYQRNSRYLLGVFFMVIYHAILMASFYWQGYWTYPILGVMNSIQRSLFFALVYAIYTTAYVVGCKANSKICGVGVGGSTSISHHIIDKKFS